MYGIVNKFKAPAAGDTGIDIRFIEALVNEVIASGRLHFSQRFVVTRLGNGGYHVDMPAADGLPFSGTAYIAGNKTTGLNSDSSKPWVRCFLDTGTAEENAGPPSNPFPFNEEWYEKAQTSGDIHIPRA